MGKNQYPLEDQRRLAPWRPVAGAWAFAAGCEVEDVQQEVLVAILRGLRVDSAVPTALKIRKVNGRWRSTDPAVCASLAGCEVDGDENQLQIAAPEQPDLADLAKEGLAEALDEHSAVRARRLGVGVRRAQQLRKAQIERFVRCGDLFGGVAS